MNVADLARELDLPPSRVIDLCARLGIDATWAGADLSPLDEEALRTNLGGESTGADGPRRADVGHQLGTSEALPPTAVGSYPGLADDSIPEHPTPGFVFAGDALAGSDAEPEAGVDSKPGQAGPNPVRTFDPSLRTAVVATALAAVAVVAAEVLDRAPVALVGWLLAALCFLTVLVAANRARYRISTHPERRRGRPLAVGLLLVAVLGLGGLALGTWTVVRSAPAAQAPLGMGDLQSVQHLRWGYQRLMVIADNGWSRPAKDAGTCWEASGPSDEPRMEERLEHGYERVSCNSEHQFEVLAAFSVNRDADAPYPGVDALADEALRRCEGALDGLVADAPDDLFLVAEVPTREGWEAGDHDVTCVSALLREEPLRE